MRIHYLCTYAAIANLDQGQTLVEGDLVQRNRRCQSAVNFNLAESSTEIVLRTEEEQQIFNHFISIIIVDN